MSRFINKRVLISRQRDEWFCMQTMKKNNQKWIVYILKCSDNTYYTGITNNLERRIYQHNNGSLGAKYTRCRRPVELIESKIVNTKSEALKLEYKIKSLKRNKKINYLKDYRSNSEN